MQHTIQQEIKCVIAFVAAMWAVFLQSGDGAIRPRSFSRQGASRPAILQAVLAGDRRRPSHRGFPGLRQHFRQ
jgi:hypothetical protein